MLLFAYIVLFLLQVLSFFYRQILSIGLLVMAVWPLTTPNISNSQFTVGWIASCCFLAIFPLLPPVGRVANYELVYVCDIFIIDSLHEYVHIHKRLVLVHGEN